MDIFGDLTEPDNSVVCVLGGGGVLYTVEGLAASLVSIH